MCLDVSGLSSSTYLLQNAANIYSSFEWIYNMYKKNLIFYKYWTADGSQPNLREIEIF